MRRNACAMQFSNLNNIPVLKEICKLIRETSSNQPLVKTFSKVDIYLYIINNLMLRIAYLSMLIYFEGRSRDLGGEPHLPLPPWASTLSLSNVSPWPLTYVHVIYSNIYNIVYYETKCVFVYFKRHMRLKFKKNKHKYFQYFRERRYIYLPNKKRVKWDKYMYIYTLNAFNRAYLYRLQYQRVENRSGFWPELYEIPANNVMPPISADPCMNRYEAKTDLAFKSKKRL